MLIARDGKAANALFGIATLATFACQATNLRRRPIAKSTDRAKADRAKMASKSAMLGQGDDAFGAREPTTRSPMNKVRNANGPEEREALYE